MKKLIITLALVLLATTAWGQTWQPAWPTDECRTRYWTNWYPQITYADGGTIQTWCLEDDKRRAHPIWGDSRYRLERNEITGWYRITENRNGKWEPIYNQIDNQVSVSGVTNARVLEEYNKRVMIQVFEHYRQLEREENAWKPIR